MYDTYPKIILASKSPRRQQLLMESGLNFEIRTQEVEEVYPKNTPIQEVPAFLAKLKASAILPEIISEQLIIGADTLVLLGDRVLGKPRTEDQAYEMLNALSGKKHSVITGVCLLSTKQEMTFSRKTDVYFSKLEDWQIEHYITHFLPYDKAGAYAIQEWIGLIGVKKIKGCYYNVMGLPVNYLMRKLKRFVEKEEELVYSN